MDEKQLERFLKRIPNLPFDSEHLTSMGTNFIDGISPESEMLFGGRADGKHRFFGVTSILYVPLGSHPVRIGERNEIEMTYSPEEFLALTKTYEQLRKRPLKFRIDELGEKLFPRRKN